jgi:hypothetical protein
MRKRKNTSTQKHLPFKSIKEGVIVMKDGSFKVVLMVNSINYNLKSSDEKKALLNSYQNFLNSLSYPIQIVVQSRVLNLDEYLNNLEKLSKTQTNELLQQQTREYTVFIKDLIGIANIMNKTFYIVIDYHPHLQAQGNFFARLFGKKPITARGRFNENKEELLRRAEIIANSLSPMGLNSVLLNTEELIDLFYTTYNPDVSRKQKLFNINQVDADIITTTLKEEGVE